MATLILTIGQRAPILQDDEPGSKTVFVKCIKNWPSTVGQTEPSIPLDIILTFETSSHNIFRRWESPLAAVGSKLALNTDELIINAYYEGHGLGVPFSRYIIECSVTYGLYEEKPIILRRSKKYSAAPVIYPSISGFYDVPEFASEVRIITDSSGLLVLNGNASVGDGIENQTYQFDEIFDWKPIQICATRYQVQVEYLGERSGAAGNGLFTIEFR